MSFLSANKPRLIDLNSATVTQLTAAPTGLNRGLAVDHINGYIYNAGTTNSQVTVLATAVDILTTTVPNASAGTPTPPPSTPPAPCREASPSPTAPSRRA